MWKTIELIIVVAIVLVFITEFFYPLFSGKPLFASFRKQPTSTAPQKGQPPLEDKINLAKEKVHEIKTIQNEVNENYKSAEELKKEADDLLS